MMEEPPREEESDFMRELKDKDVNVVQSLISLAIENQAMIRTCLGMLISDKAEQEGKPREEIERQVWDSVKKNRNLSVGLLVTMPKESDD